MYTEFIRHPFYLFILKNNYMTEKVGTIISTEDSPSSEKISFVLEKPVNKEQFVEYDAGNGKAIARVSRVRKSNIFYHNPESVSESAKNDVKLQDQFPTEEREQLIGEGRILGIYTPKLIKRPSFPPSPGTEIYLADKNRLADFLGLDIENGLNLGEVQFQELDAKINMTKLFQKHFAILAQSGAGKSYLASVMIEEILDRDRKKGNIGLVSIDPHGEYAGFGRDHDYGHRVEVFRGNDIKIGLSNITPGKMAHYFSDVSTAQKREIIKVISEMRKKMRNGGGAYSLKDMERNIEEADMDKKTKRIWLDRINRMKSMNLFGLYDQPSINRVEQGKMVVLDLSDIIDYKKKQIITAYFGDRLFKARMNGEIPPFLFLVEEAHNFVPENVSSDVALARSTITKIAREGRKFHASLGLISQRPVGLSTTALSQCNTHMILRVTNPNDLERIKQSSEGVTSDVIRSISGLRVGEGILVGEAVDYPTFISIRQRKSEEFETGKNLEEAALEYREKVEKEKDEIDAFM